MANKIQMTKPKIYCKSGSSYCPECHGSSWETQFVTVCKQCKGTGIKEKLKYPAY